MYDGRIYHMLAVSPRERGDGNRKKGYTKVGTIHLHLEVVLMCSMDDKAGSPSYELGSTRIGGDR